MALDGDALVLKIGFIGILAMYDTSSLLKALQFILVTVPYVSKFNLKKAKKSLVNIQFIFDKLYCNV